MKEFVVGVDVGGQTTKIGVVDARGDVLSQTIIRTDTYGTDAAAYIAALADAVKDSVAQSGKTMDDIRGIGVGAPNGNYYTGEVAFAPNLAWAASAAVPFSKMLSEALDGMPVSLTNDANAAAVGEMAYGAARGMKNFIMITLGTGLRRRTRPRHRRPPERTRLRLRPPRLPRGLLLRHRRRPYGPRVAGRHR